MFRIDRLLAYLMSLRHVTVVFLCSSSPCAVDGNPRTAQPRLEELHTRIFGDQVLTDMGHPLLQVVIESDSALVPCLRVSDAGCDALEDLCDVVAQTIRVPQ